MKKERIEEIAKRRGYFVSEDGTMYNPSGNKVGTWINDNGYYCLSLRINKKTPIMPIHRLQAFQKYGQALFLNGIMVRHYNGNKLDNSWDNILIGTSSENQLDIPEQVRIKRALYATSFVRKYDREKIRKYYNTVKSYKKTKEKFNISSSGTLHFILNGRKK